MSLSTEILNHMTMEEYVELRQQLADDISLKIKDMHTKGSQEYAMNQSNVFANFERIAEQTGSDREMVLWIYLMKHIDGIASYLKGHKSQREHVTGRLTDAIVYLCILWGMIEQNNKKEKMKKTPTTNKQNGEIQYGTHNFKVSV